jgi:hypothetical protein
MLLRIGLRVKAKMRKTQAEAAKIKMGLWQ